MSVMVVAGRVPATGYRRTVRTETMGVRMRMVNRDINVYYHHDTLTPENVRAAIYGTETHPSLLPEVGDIISDFPGYMGELVKVRVVKVTQIGQGCEAYDVRVETVEL